MKRRLAVLTLALLLSVPVVGAITFQGATTEPDSKKSSGLELAVPAGNAGDLLLAHVTQTGGAKTEITPPSGWTLVLRTDHGKALSQAVYWKYATANESASYEWVFDKNERSAGGILRYAGTHASSPIAAAAGATTTGTDLTMPSVSSDALGSTLVAFYAIDTGTSFTQPTGMTVRYTASERSTLQASDQTLPAIGASGTRTATAAASGDMVGQLVVLRPPPPAVRVGFASAASNGAESTTSVQVPVTLSTASAKPTQVDYAVTGGTATPGTDFVLAPGTLTIPAGQTVANIAFTVVDDPLPEADETIVITLTNPRNATLAATAVHTYTIVNDDSEATTVLHVSANPVTADGTPALTSSWGGWNAEAGQTNVAATNYLKITNAGTRADPRAVIGFSGGAFGGTEDGTFSIPITNNVQYAWWEDTTPGSTAPNEGTYSWRPVSASSVTIQFTAPGNVIYVVYRIAQMPDILMAQPYAAAFTVTEL